MVDKCGRSRICGGMLLISMAALLSLRSMPSCCRAVRILQQGATAALQRRSTQTSREGCGPRPDVERALYYRTYKRCGFDADAAEGISESIARILVDHWTTLPEGAKLAENHRGFRTFMLAGINATLAGDDLEAIRENRRVARHPELRSAETSGIVRRGT